MDPATATIAIARLFHDRITDMALLFVNDALGVRIAARPDGNG